MGVPQTHPLFMALLRPISRCLYHHQPIFRTTFIRRLSEPEAIEGQMEKKRNGGLAQAVPSLSQSNVGSTEDHFACISLFQRTGEDTNVFFYI